MLFRLSTSVDLVAIVYSATQEHQARRQSGGFYAASAGEPFKIDGTL